MVAHQMNRRQFVGLSAASVAGGILGLRSAYANATRGDAWDPGAPLMVTGKPLRVQPILMYRVAERREATSWKSWGGVQDDQAAEKESRQIAEELGFVRQG